MSEPPNLTFGNDIRIWLMRGIDAVRSDMLDEGIPEKDVDAIIKIIDTSMITATPIADLKLNYAIEGT